MPLDLRNYRNAVLVFVLFIFLHSLKYFDFMGLDVTIYGRVSNALVLLLILICAISKSPHTIPGQFWFLGFLLVPMLSFLPCWLENGQDPITSMRAYMSVGLSLVYFLLHNGKIREADLIKGITVFAIIRVCILVLQQFTYPDYWFSMRPEGVDTLGHFKSIEIRNGIYRFCIEDTILSMFLVFYYISRFIRDGKNTDLLLFFVGLVGVYLDQTRQYMVSTVIALLIVLFFSSRMKYKWLVVLVFLVIIGIVLAFSRFLFQDLLLMTEQDLTSDNIRLFAYATYLFEFWGGPLSVIFGNGPIGNSAYGEQVYYMYDNLRLFHSDVGIVGAANLYGFTTVLFLVCFFIFFVGRNWKKIPMHLKMYYIAMVINLPMISVFTQSSYYMVFFGFMLFLTDRSIRRYDYKAFRRWQASKRTSSTA